MLSWLVENIDIGFPEKMSKNYECVSAQKRRERGVVLKTYL